VESCNTKGAKGTKCDFLVAKLSLIVLQMGRNFTQGALLGSFTFLERTSWLQFANAR